MRYGEALNEGYLTAENIRTLVGTVALLQFLGALLTFTPTRERRRGHSFPAVIAYAVVVTGTTRADLFNAAAIPGCLGLAGALGLFAWARLATQGRFFSYIASTDTPKFICTDGPYRWIRHPFYASYLLTLVSTAVLFPSLVTIIGTAVAILGFNRSAKFEEDKFEDSPLASEYRAYMTRTGRFLPGF